MMKKAALHNLGCKVNSYETEVMGQKLREKGYEIVPFDSVADVYIVNTCTVTNIADRKSRQLLHRARQKNPEAVVVAVGCYVQTGQEAIRKDDSIDLAIGNNHKGEIAELLEEFLEKRGGGKRRDCVVTDINHTSEYEEMQLERSEEHIRVHVKIQDGCNQFCSYCAIPYARGRVRSRRAEDILTEVRGIAERGFREIVLTGIHISSYGIDFDDEAWKRGESVPMRRGDGLVYRGAGKLVELVELLCQIPGIERIRLGSLEPRIVTEEAVRRLAALSKLCPHFHLSLQSGCDATLKRMNRHYTVGEYYSSVELLRRAFSHPAITTDVIVGFPGETEEEFAETERFLEKVCFYEMHIFRYSKRQGTAAAELQGQVPEDVKAARSDRLFEMERRQSEEFRRTYIGQEVEILTEDTEEIDGKLWRVGHTRDYVKVATEEKEARHSNAMERVRVQGFLTDKMLAAVPAQ